ncbi:hypothetical protein GCM10020331_036790 [Ectobacillus funiculus]
MDCDKTHSYAEPINEAGGEWKLSGRYSNSITGRSRDAGTQLSFDDHKKIRELIQKNYHIELRQKNAELYALQSQINPHFYVQYIGNDQHGGRRRGIGNGCRYGNAAWENASFFSLGNKDRILPISEELLHIKDYLRIQKV